MHVRTTALAAAVLVLAGCQTASPLTSPSSSPEVWPSVSPFLFGNYFVVAEPDRVTPANQHITLRVLLTNAVEVSRFTLKPGVEVLAVRGRRIFVFSSGHLKTIEGNGAVVDRGPLGTSSPGQLVPSPDGNRWLWSTYVVNGNAVHSVVHLGGDGQAASVIEDVMEDVHVLEPFSWTARGVFVQHSPMGIGGYRPFAPAVGPVDRLDPATWTVTPEPRSNTCAFSDEAIDGTMACFPRSGDQATSRLALISPGGSQRAVVLPRPQYTLYGDAYFDPTGTHVTVSGAEGLGGTGERFTTGLVNVATGVLTPIDIAGVRPAFPDCWLPGARLLLWRTGEAAGQPPGVYVVARYGNSPFIQFAGVPIGHFTNY
jgi:hypothetical protein